MHKGVWPGPNKNLMRVLALLMVIALALCCGYIVAEAGHDCVGHACPVCPHVHACMNVLQGLLAVCAASIVAGAVLTAAVHGMTLGGAHIPAETPVSMKVRLDN